MSVSKQLEAISTDLETRYFINPGTNVVYYDGSELSDGERDIRHESADGVLIARDLWRDGYLLRREYFDKERLLGRDRFQFEGKMLAMRVREFDLSDGATIEERWLQDGTFVGRYLVLKDAPEPFLLGGSHTVKGFHYRAQPSQCLSIDSDEQHEVDPHYRTGR